MSRLRSDIPIYAFSRNEATGRRVTMYRGVFPVMFDVVGCNTAEALYNAIFARLLELELVQPGRPGDRDQGRALGRAGRHQFHADPQGHPHLMRGRPVVGLVLTGGGARAAYQVGVLQALTELLPRNRNPFPVIAGTSAGAVSASVLASQAHHWRAAVAGLADVWSNFRVSQVFKVDTGHMLIAGARWLDGAGHPAASWPRRRIRCSTIRRCANC